LNNAFDVKGNDKDALDRAIRLFRISQSRRVWTFRVLLMLSLPNACLIIDSVSVALFPRFVQNMMLFPCRIHCDIASGQYTTPNKRTQKITTSTQSVKFCTLTTKVCQYYHLPLHRATTTAVQFPAPVSEMLDNPLVGIVYYKVYSCV
jgi:hypothetical protein